MLTRLRRRLVRGLAYANLRTRRRRHGIVAFKARAARRWTGDSPLSPQFGLNFGFGGADQAESCRSDPTAGSPIAQCNSAVLP